MLGQSRIWDVKQLPKLAGLVLWMGLAGFSCRPAIRSDLPIVHLTLNHHEVLAEVANKVPTRDAGLMFRKSMGENNGMLFVFHETALRAFWMKNTYIPLSIAFMDDKGIILNVLEMPPLTEDSFFSKGGAKYALEMNAGWFEKNGLKPGDPVIGLDQAPSADE
jgi:hypothetical protein